MSFLHSLKRLRQTYERYLTQISEAARLSQQGMGVVVHMVAWSAVQEQQLHTDVQVNLRFLLPG